MKHLVVIVAGCIAAGCAAAPIEPPPPTTAFAPLMLDEFPGAAMVLHGFDERTTARDWGVHDQALFGLQLDKGGDTTRWLLHIESLGDVPVSAVESSSSSTNADGSVTVQMKSLGADAVVKVMQPDGTVLNETRVRLPASYLAEGLLPSIGAGTKAGTDGKEPPFGVALRLAVRGWFTMSALLDVVRGNDVLADYFWQVVDTPGLWSVITHLGVTPRVQLSWEKSVAVDLVEPLPKTADSFSVPLRIEVNGAPALFVDLLASDASRPYALCGGIVAASARHPTRPDVSFRMQLIAARCGRSRSP